MNTENGSTAIKAALIGAAATILAALLGMTSRGRDIVHTIITTGTSNQQKSTTISPVDTGTLYSSPTTAPPLQTIKSGRLSQDLLFDSKGRINFYPIRNEMIVAGKLFSADFEQAWSDRVNYKLDQKQKQLILQCAVPDNSGGNAVQLKVIGDGNELWSQGFKKGEAQIRKEIDITGVQILSLETEGDYVTYLYCTDELAY